MKEIIKKTCLVLITLLLASCSANPSSSLSSSSSSHSLSSSEDIVVTPAKEYEGETNIFAYKSSDSIEKDYAHNMAIHNIAAKALTSKNHQNRLWRQNISGTLSGLPFSSRQETTYLNAAVGYRESSIFSMGINIGRTVNAYKDTSGYVFGHSRTRTVDLSIFGNSTESSGQLNIPKNDLRHVEGTYVSKSIGDFSRIENLFPINSMTIDEEESKLSVAGDIYTLTLHADKFSIFANLINRYNIENTDFITYFDTNYNTDPDLEITYSICNDYSLQKIEYRWQNEVIDVSSTVEICEIDTIANIDSYVAIMATPIIQNPTSIMESFFADTSSLFKNIVVQLANTSQFTLPLTLYIGKDEENYFSLSGLIEFQTSWSLSDFTNLDFDDRDRVLQTVLRCLNFNIRADIKIARESVLETSVFVTSYNCTSQKGQFTFTGDEQKVVQNYVFADIDTFDDIAELIKSLAAERLPDDSQEKAAENRKKICAKLQEIYRSQIADPAFDGSLKYIDFYFIGDLVDADQVKTERVGKKVNSVFLEGRSSDVEKYLVFLNGNDPAVIANAAMAALDDSKPELGDQLHIDYSSCLYTFALRQNRETLLLDELSWTFTVKINDQKYTFSLLLAELKEMNSLSEFIVDKYISKEDMV